MNTISGRSDKSERDKASFWSLYVMGCLVQDMKWRFICINHLKELHFYLCDESRERSTSMLGHLSTELGTILSEEKSCVNMCGLYLDIKSTHWVCWLILMVLLACRLSVCVYMWTWLHQVFWVILLVSLCVYM